MAALLDGNWLIPTRGIVLSLAQNSQAVSGDLNDVVFKCKLTGHFDGAKLSIAWVSGFSYTNQQESGSGDLHLSGDRNALTGDLTLFGVHAHCAFAREHPLPPPAPPPANYEAMLRQANKGPHVPAFPPPNEPFREPESNKAKRAWDDQRDSGAQENAARNKAKREQDKKLGLDQ